VALEVAPGVLERHVPALAGAGRLDAQDRGVGIVLADQGGEARGGGLGGVGVLGGDGGERELGQGGGGLVPEGVGGGAQQRHGVGGPVAEHGRAPALVGEPGRVALDPRERGLGRLAVTVVQGQHAVAEVRTEGAVGLLACLVLRLDQQLELHVRIGGDLRLLGLAGHALQVAGVELREQRLGLGDQGGIDVAGQVDRSLQRHARGVGLARGGRAPGLGDLASRQLAADLGEARLDPRLLGGIVALAERGQRLGVLAAGVAQLAPLVEAIPLGHQLIEVLAEEREQRRSLRGGRASRRRRSRRPGRRGRSRPCSRAARSRSGRT
jgi:hypothetical protein